MQCIKLLRVASCVFRVWFNAMEVAAILNFPSLDIEILPNAEKLAAANRTNNGKTHLLLNPWEGVSI